MYREERGCICWRLLNVIYQNLVAFPMCVFHDGGVGCIPLVSVQPGCKDSLIISGWPNSPFLAGTWRDDTAPPLPLLTDPSFKGYRVHMLLVITIVLLIFCFYFNQRVSEPDGSGP